MRVLIIEDEKGMAELLKKGLEEENHRVALAFVRGAHCLLCMRPIVKVVGALVKETTRILRPPIRMADSE